MKGARRLLGQRIRAAGEVAHALTRSTGDAPSLRRPRPRPAVVAVLFVAAGLAAMMAGVRPAASTQTTCPPASPTGCVNVNGSVTGGPVVGPGTTLTYTFTSRNVGGTSVGTNVRASIVGQPVTYVPESVVIDGVPRTDAADADGGFSNGTDEIGMDDFTTHAAAPGPGASHVVSFQATVNPGSSGSHVVVSATGAYQAGGPSAVSNDVRSNVGPILLSQVSGPDPAPPAFAPPVDADVGSEPFKWITGDLNNDNSLDLVVVIAGAVSVALSDGAGGFGPPTSLPISLPWGVAVGDFNSDGYSDVVGVSVSSALLGKLAVWLNDGSGGFGPRVDFPAGGSSRDVVVADFNGDGNADLAVVLADGTATLISVLAGDGNAGFSSPSTFPLEPGGDPFDIDIGDFNADGRTDLVVANTIQSGGLSGDDVSVLLGNGSGGFEPYVSFPAGSFPLEVAVGDLNGDGKADLAVANGGSPNRASMLLGDGAGSFSPAVSIPLTRAPNSVAIADLNGDGAMDLATASGHAYVSVLLGDGSGSFGAGFDFPTGGVPSIDPGVVAADFNHDGRTDVASLTSGVAIQLAVPPSISPTVGDALSDTVTLTGAVSPTGTLSFNGYGPGDSGCAGPPVFTATAAVDGNGSYRSPPFPTTDPGTYRFIATYGGDANNPAVASACGDPFETVAVAKAVPVLSTQAAGPIAAPSFAPAADFAVGSDPQGSVVGDFNGDGRADLAVAELSGHVSVLLGDGAGGLGPPATFATGDNPLLLAAHDLSGDGILDLAVTSGGSSSTDVSVLLGNGAGGFGSAVNYPVGGLSGAVVVADFNGDARPDLAVTVPVSNNVSVLLGDGSGGFAAAVSFTAGTLPYGMVTADLDDDSDSDLVVANYGADDVSVLLGDGAGGFEPAANFPAGPSPAFVALADFDGDGIDDLAVANIGATGGVTVLAGNGGGFEAPRTVDAGRVGPILATDLNGDAKPDLVSADFVARSVLARVGDGTGAFGPPVTIAAGTQPTWLGTGDFNADGKADVTMTSAESASVSLLLNQTVTAPPSPEVRMGEPISDIATVADAYNATGTLVFRVFEPGDPTCAGTPAATSMATVSGNGAYPSASFTTSSAGTHHWIASYSGDANNEAVSGACGDFNESVSVAPATIPTLVTQSSGPLMAAAAALPPGTGPVNVAVGDFDEDGQADLVVANDGANTVSIKVGDGAGGFTQGGEYAVGANPDSVAVADFDVDGHADLAVANTGSDTVSVLLGNGTGGFGPPIDTAAGTAWPSFLSVGDFDGDAKPDLLVNPYNSNTVTILSGDGTGAFTSTTLILADQNRKVTTVADFNGDGRSDFATDSVRVYLANDTGDFDPGPIVYPGGSAQSIVAGDLNGDANADLVVFVGGNLIVLLGDGAGGFMAAGSVTSDLGRAMAIGDFNDDGLADVALNGFLRPDSSFATDILVFLGDGQGGLAPRVGHPGATGSGGLAVGDFDGDGRSDLATERAVLLARSPVTVLVGTAISDAALLAGGSAPTGTIDFQAFGPDDATCSGSPVFTDSQAVTGNGRYQSASFTPGEGTYRWVASYSGDGANAPVAGACNDTNESVVVVRTQPTLSTQASDSVAVGGIVTDSANLSGGLSPTGTITFNLYGPADPTCTAAPVFTSTQAVTGNFGYPSDPYIAPVIGTYRFVASYSGDALNAPVAGACNDPDQSVTVVKALPRLTTLALGPGSAVPAFGSRQTFGVGSTSVLR